MRTRLLALAPLVAIVCAAAPPAQVQAASNDLLDLSLAAALAARAAGDPGAAQAFLDAEKVAQSAGETPRAARIRLVRA
ncbi:MAG: hypothetical protein Fur0037_14340 [Planctomycetota bacterium]